MSEFVTVCMSPWAPGVCPCERPPIRSQSLVMIPIPGAPMSSVPFGNSSYSESTLVKSLGLRRQERLWVARRFLNRFGWAMRIFLCVFFVRIPL